jgi:hypothetical protein
MVIEGDQKFKIWLPMIENNSCWWCKMGFGHHIVNDQKWVSIEIWSLDGNQKLAIESWQLTMVIESWRSIFFDHQSYGDRICFGSPYIMR